MRIRFIIIAVFLFQPLVSIFADAAPNSIPAIAILDFEPRNGVTTDISDFVSDRVRIELFKTGKFRIVERKEMQKVLEEQKMELAGLTGSEYAVKIGKLLSAQKIMLGTVNKIDNSYFINGRVINVETAVMESGETAEAASASELSGASGQLVRGIANPGGESSAAKKNNQSIAATPSSGPIRGEDLAVFINSTINYFKDRVDAAILNARASGRMGPIASMSPDNVLTNDNSDGDNTDSDTGDSETLVKKVKSDRDRAVQNRKKQKQEQDNSSQTDIQQSNDKHSSGEKISVTRLIVGESLGICIPGLGLAHFVVGDTGGGIALVFNSLAAAGIFFGNEYAFNQGYYPETKAEGIHRALFWGGIGIFAIGYLTDIIGAPIYYFDKNSKIGLGLTAEPPLYALKTGEVNFNLIGFQSRF